LSDILITEITIEQPVEMERKEKEKKRKRFFFLDKLEWLNLLIFVLNCIVIVTFVLSLYLCNSSPNSIIHF